MSLIVPKPKDNNDRLAYIYLAEAGISILECDICGNSFSASMEWAWPFCSAGIPHENMPSKEQIRRQALLALTPEKATASFVDPLLKLYGPTHLKVSWEDSILPDFPQPHISLPREKLKELNDNYKIMAAFIGNILGKHKFNMMDIVRFSRIAWYRQPEETK